MSDAESDYSFGEQDVDKLAETDPEFHKWLSSQNPELLKFKAEEDLESDAESLPEDDSDPEDEVTKEEEVKEENSEDEMNVDPEGDITDEFLENLIINLAKGKQNAFKMLVSALVASCDFLAQDDEAEKRSNMIKKEDSSNRQGKSI